VRVSGWKGCCGGSSEGISELGERYGVEGLDVFLLFGVEVG
jgi:hypothetical protein